MIAEEAQTRAGREAAPSVLPAGQYEVDRFPRFGLTPFAERFPRQTERIEIAVTGDIGAEIVVTDEYHDLPRFTQTADFHCVTTWTHRSLEWGGVRFADFYERIVVPRARPAGDSTLVLLRAQDGYRTTLPLADLLAADVMLADTLNGVALTIEHGAPLRLVAPAHYGYKSAKHLSGIGFWRDARQYRPPALAFMDHPRGRVALEERGKIFPGWLLRYLYRPLVASTARKFQHALDRHLSSGSSGR